jgi:hypothetical protein
MLGRWVSITAVAFAGVFPATALVSVASPTEARAAPGPTYRVGTKLNAKRDCTLQGFAIKKGVVLTVSSVSDDGKAVDLEFSGMTISGVNNGQVASLFQRV